MEGFNPVFTNQHTFLQTGGHVIGQLPSTALQLSLVYFNIMIYFENGYAQCAYVHCVVCTLFNRALVLNKKCHRPGQGDSQSHLARRFVFAPEL